MSRKVSRWVEIAMMKPADAAAALAEIRARAEQNGTYTPAMKEIWGQAIVGACFGIRMIRTDMLKQMHVRRRGELVAVRNHAAWCMSKIGLSYSEIKDHLKCDRSAVVRMVRRHIEVAGGADV